MKTKELISKAIDSHGRNWARYVTSGDPLIQDFHEAVWVRFMVPDIEQAISEEKQPPVDYRSARVVDELYKSLPWVCRVVMRSYWVYNVYWGSPKSDDDTVRCLNILLRHNRLIRPDAISGYQFTMHSYQNDMKYIARKMEEALEVR